MMIDDAFATAIYNRRRQAAEPKELEGEGTQARPAGEPGTERPAVPPWSAEGAAWIYEHRREQCEALAKKEAQRG